MLLDKQLNCGNFILWLCPKSVGT